MRYERYEQTLLRDCFCGPGRADETRKMLEKYSRYAAQLKAGDTMYLGRFRVPQGGKPMEAGGPVMNIRWRILERRGSELILISEYALDWEFFDDNKTTWTDSFLRRVLNSEYLQEWFTPAEQQLLCGEPDKLYLMTAAEAKKYFPEPGSAKAYMPFVDFGDEHDHICYTVEREAYSWWLNTPGSEPYCVAIADWRGNIDEEGINCASDEIGVRPMIRIDLSGINRLQ